MTPVVELLGISKHFPGAQALQEVNFEVRRGEVHALMGENGAGKSTLMKILAGVYTPDRGIIRVDGQERRFHTPQEAQAAGIQMIHQESATLPNLDVGRNIMLGREPRRGFRLDAGLLYKKAQDILESLRLVIPLKTPLEELPLGQRQMVEIARAIAAEPRVLVMDEPTSSLGKHEEEALFELVERLRSRGVSIVYISHRMPEVFRLADRVTVLRDGKYVGTRPVTALDESQLIEMMIGRRLEPRARERKKPGDVVLKVEELRAGRAQKVSFSLRAGEVLGLAGLVGAGRSEAARAIVGLDRIEEGNIELAGRQVRFRNPEEALRAGVVYVPEDRKGLGLVLMHSIRRNLALPSLRGLSRYGIVRESAVDRLVQTYMDRLRIKAPSAAQIVENLSGGNQQKVVLAKWLALRPQVLILDEPTRGIDVQAKAEVYELVHELTSEGMAVLLISSESNEILRESDRIVVLHQGHVVGELEADTATERQLVSLAFGQKGAA
jgi:ABC-type sugar transport system ATPase subunit